ncbi:MAG: histidinol-phosphatase HisJ family protein [bacterium]
MLLHDDHVHLRAHNIPPEPHNLTAMLEEAEKRGLAVGIREHPPLPKKFRLGPYADFDYAMREDEVDGFLKLFADTKCSVGFEFDFLAGEENEIISILDRITKKTKEKGVSISGIHGSVHLLPGSVKDVDYPKGDVKHIIWDLDEEVFIAHLKDRGPKQLLHDYFGAMHDLIKLGIYDCLSHIDLIRKFDRRNQAGESIYFSEAEKLYDMLSRSVVERVKDSGMAIEINTAGMFQPLGRPYISQELLNYAVELGVPVCIGSDAHTPARLGAHFDLALKMLESAGRDYIVTFQNREMEKYSLP